METSEKDASSDCIVIQDGRSSKHAKRNGKGRECIGWIYHELFNIYFMYLKAANCAASRHTRSHSEEHRKADFKLMSNIWLNLSNDITWESHLP